MALRDFINRVKQGVEDVATLDVITSRGKVEIARTEAGEVDFDALFQSIQSQMTVGEHSTIRVLAATRMQFDKDTLNFIADDLTEEDKEILRTTHWPGVQSAIVGRENIIKLGVGVLDAIIPG
ncbi:MAG: hypothetical protein GY791_08385 [Alphaproteobacteria bacterium]|nr:hypothetical protein [Alphaproteobacteria bacterium]